MLEEFDRAFKSFEENAYSKLYQYCFDADKENYCFKVQIQGQSLASDIGYSSMIVRDLYLEALQSVSSKMNQQVVDHVSGDVGSSEVFRTLDVPFCKLAVSFKNLFFLIRAYQDILYRLILILEGQSAGKGTGMKKAIDGAKKEIKKESPVRKILIKAYPDYANWFILLREWRNFSKDGVGVSYSMGKNFETNETKLAIRLGSPTIKQSPDFSLEDISKALNISSSLTSIIVEHGIKNGRLSR